MNTGSFKVSASLFMRVAWLLLGALFVTHFVHAEVDPQTGQGCRQILVNTGNFLDSKLGTLPTQITSVPFSITSPGNYALSSSLTGSIVIDSDYVTLDLNGYHLSGAYNGVVINGCDHVTVKNGFVGPVSNTGVLVQPCSSSIVLDNLQIADCAYRGIDVYNSSKIDVNNCYLSTNSVGFYATNIQKAVINKCIASTNKTAGYWLNCCKNNELTSCKAQDTSSSDTTYGFICTGGGQNTFRNCSAEGITTATTLDGQFAGTGKFAAGYMLKYPTFANTIKNSMAKNIHAGITSHAYGMVLGEGNNSLSDLITSNHAAEVESVAWSPDGRYIAVGGVQVTGTPNITTRVYAYDSQASTLTQIATADHGNTVNCVAWSPDGQYLVTGGDLASGVTTRVYSFNPVAGTLVQFCVADPDHGEQVRSVSWSPDGSYVAVAGSNGAGVSLGMYAFDIANHTLERKTTALINDAYAVSWHPSGKYIALGGVVSGVTTVRVYAFDTATNTLTVLPGCDKNHSAQLWQLSWRYDGNYLAAAGGPGDDGYACHVYAFNNEGLSSSLTELPGCAVVNGAGTWLGAVSWSPDGQYIAVAGGGVVPGSGSTVYRFDEGNGKLIRLSGCDKVHGAWVNSVSWSPDCQSLVIGGAIGTGTITTRMYAFDTSAGSLIELAGCNKIHAADKTVESVSWHPDGNYLAIGGARVGSDPYITTRVYAFDAFSDTLTELLDCQEDHGATVYSVAWSPDGKYLATGGNPGTDNFTTRIYSFDSASDMLTTITSVDHGTVVYELAWSPDGNYLATVGARYTDDLVVFVTTRVYKFDASAGSLLELPACRKDHAHLVYSVSWSPDGNYVATTGEPSIIGGITSRVYGFSPVAETLTELSNCQKNHDAATLAVAWSPDGQYLTVGGLSALVGGWDARTYLFDSGAKNLTELDGCKIEYGVGIGSVAWSPDGTYLVVGGDGSTNATQVYVFDASTATMQLLSACSAPHGAGITCVRWRPDGQYIAMGGLPDPSTGVGIRAYSGPVYPWNCCIKNNEMYDTTVTGTGTYVGVGLAAPGLINDISSNYAYNNDINYNGAVGNVQSGHTDATNYLANVALPSQFR